MQPSLHLDYAALGAPPSWLRRAMPAWLAPLSLLPIALTVLILFTPRTWNRWLNLGQGWEQLCGRIWLASLALSLAWIVFYLARPKRMADWICITLHIGWMGISLLPPGLIALAWLNHWLSGPGA